MCLYVCEFVVEKFAEASIGKPLGTFQQKNRCGVLRIAPGSATLNDVSLLWPPLAMF